MRTPKLLVASRIVLLLAVVAIVGVLWLPEQFRFLLFFLLVYPAYRLIDWFLQKPSE